MKKIDDLEVLVEVEKIVDEENKPVKQPVNEIDRFMECIVQGLPFESACNYCGFPSAVVREWLEEGEKEQKAEPHSTNPSKKRLFYERYVRAEAIFEGQMVKPIIESAKRGSVQSAEWILEHRRPESFNKLPSETPKEAIIIVNDIKKGK